MTGSPASYFEDVAVGDRVESPGITVTAAHADLYRALSGEEPPGTAGVPDLLPLCLASGLGWRVDRPPLAVTVFLGFEWEFLQPVQVGDTVRVVARTAGRRAMRDGGLVVEEHELLDQRGGVVQRGRFTVLVARRPAPGAGDKESAP